MAEKPHVLIHDIDDLKLTTKTKIIDQKIVKVVVVSFECRLLPIDLARIYNFDRQDRPIDIVLESPQAELDLRVENLNIKSGELTG